MSNLVMIHRPLSASVVSLCRRSNHLQRNFVIRYASFSSLLRSNQLPATISSFTQYYDLKSENRYRMTATASTSTVFVLDPLRYQYQVRTFASQNNKKSESQKGDESLHESTFSDPPVLTWVDTYLPDTAKPYARLARLDKPIGTWLLLWPCFWSTALASASQSSLPDPFLMSLFSVGALVMRGAGCTINDLWDQDIDRKVARTRTRPLAGGDVTTKEAIAFLAAQLTVGLGVLISLPNTWYCFQWGAASLPLVAIYPLTKRFFPYPQFFLGLTFNWGAWMGWAATHGSMDYSVILPLYGSGVLWTLVYDTIYAHQDKHDDAKLGLQSTALTFGKEEEKQRQILHGLAAATWLQWMAVGYNASDYLAFPYFQMGATAAYAHLAWQIQSADFENPHNLMARFRSNSTVGALIFGSLAAGSYFQ